MRLKWKRKNDSEQYHSQCGRFWFVALDSSDCPWIRLWHDDTDTLVGHYLSASECKAAAQSYLDGLKRPDRVEDDGGPTAEDLGHSPGEEADDKVSEVAKDILAVFMHPDDQRYQEVLEATKVRISSLLPDAI